MIDFILVAPSHIERTQACYILKETARIAYVKAVTGSLHILHEFW